MDTRTNIHLIVVVVVGTAVVFDGMAKHPMVLMEALMMMNGTSFRLKPKEEGTVKEGVVGVAEKEEGQVVVEQEVEGGEVTDNHLARLKAEETLGRVLAEVR